ncbi:hypothetical protein Ngar_c17690 [Candidatus Nitrososphaera gargensis Ga9.2]|uniref:Uncharacterized protein n=1 Tax=Nitrososphaera gargensis (strain Ga9.2) TaxID=1237085 RepID=K0IK83_NITGG|nr:hypothetical protein [Candidatus Nitrososphaera gargensis]AFU58702.1 hypothetical protein Ngar_c17690 [Candidatus Nitrososphaera gargensis Ga9.2]
MTSSEARFTINVREGVVELEGKESFVDKHLEKFEEIFKMAVKEAITRGLEQNIALKAQPVQAALPQELQHQEIPIAAEQQMAPVQPQPKGGNGKHTPRPTVTIHPIPVDLKANESKVGLREFYAEKKPANHYEKAAVFVYYLTKFNKQQEVRFGEILSCYEEVNEKKPSIVDIVKNSIRYKGWLEQGSEKYTARLTISGENFVKFDLPAQGEKVAQATLS